MGSEDSRYPDALGQPLVGPGRISERWSGRDTWTSPSAGCGEIVEPDFPADSQIHHIMIRKIVRLQFNWHGFLQQTHSIIVVAEQNASTYHDYWQSMVRPQRMVLPSPIPVHARRSSSSGRSRLQTTAYGLRPQCPPKSWPKQGME